MHTKVSEEAIQQELWIEDWRDGVRAIGYQMGGMKALALSIWPSKGIQAERWLSDCLNPDRAAKLDPDEFQTILELGRAHGCHALMHHVADRAHYQRPASIEPADQRAALQREFIEQTKRLGRIAVALGVKP